MTTPTSATKRVESSVILDLLRLKDERATFTAFMPVDCSSDYHGPLVAMFPLSSEDVLRMHHLSRIAYDAGAPEITMRLYCDWSAASLDTDLDRFVISTPFSDDRDIMDATDIYIDCRESGGLNLVQSGQLRLVDLAERMIEAHNAKSTILLLDPTGSLTVDDLEDIFPNKFPANNERQKTT